jgi:hypothetical protein
MLALVLHRDDSMMRIVGANVLFVALTATAACGVGGDDGGMPPQPPPVNDGQICNATLAITNGTFTPGTTPRPTDPDTGLPITGCWPVGTWTFSATLASNMCQTTPALLPSYSFKVERMLVTPDGTDTQQVLTNLTSLSGGMQAHLAVSSNGQGCEANFELGSMDGTQYWNMQPTLAKDPGVTVLGGGGDYTLFKVNGWPWK